MTAITLPVSPGPDDVDFELIGYGLQLKPVAGGPEKRTALPGDRFRVSFNSGAFVDDCRTDLQGAVVAAQTAGETVQITWPQDGVTGIGTPLIAGADQLGSVLACDGFTPSVTVKRGWVFSVTYNGRPNIHMVTADTTANGSGVIAALPIGPMLRGSPADNAAMNFATPTLQGYLDGPGRKWTETGKLWAEHAISVEEEE